MASLPVAKFPLRLQIGVLGEIAKQWRESAVGNSPVNKMPTLAIVSSPSMTIVTKLEDV
jgi:hypothetical protein